MSQQVDNKAVVESLRAEIAALRTSSESLLFAFDRIINFALVFVLGSVGIAFTKGGPLVLAAVPFPVALIVGYLLGVNAEGLSRAGHKRWLEERVNLLLSQPTFLEEKHVAPTRQGSRWFGRPGVALLQVLLGIMVIGLFVVGIVVLWQQNRGFLWLYFPAMVLALSALIFAVREVSTAYKQAYEGAKSSQDNPLLATSGQLQSRRRFVIGSGSATEPTG
jgi:hypothetical protein